MHSDMEPLPTTRSEWISTLQALHAQLHTQQAKLDQQSQFIAQLLEQIRLARQQHFGTRSERYNIDQLAWLFNEAEATLQQEAGENPAEPILSLGPTRRSARTPHRAV